MSAALLTIIIQASIEYGPKIAMDIMALFKKKEITFEEVEALFKSIPDYESYGIPEKV